MATKILRLLGVLDVVGMSKSSWYDWVRRGLAPAPVKLGPRAVGWRAADIEAWLASRQSARNDSGAEAA
ncbi:helix-turn-helix transcriptional regulator [Burkholderia ubonensis]|uniref:helix-turn-helix transcriptional regulator n=1 Tax=Burkholderia ubonensis TaxID=101571 RepID=UPI0009B4EA28|nr:AlpA family phage regulatory protein [Burkholderia ubonensis]